MVSTAQPRPDMLVTTYLHMTDPSQFRPAFNEQAKGVSIVTASTPDAEFYRFLYTSVGEQLRWRDRIIMPESELVAILAAPETSVHVMNVNGAVAGYIELDKQGDDTEIAYFGLFPAFIGKGLGKHLLSFGIQQAWADGAKQVWVHTCNLDGPHALSNYLKRGFTIYNTHIEPLPARYA